MASSKQPPDDPRDDPLPAEETVELVVRARKGDDEALDRLVRRCLPALRRWAHGRLPQSARPAQDTADLVQDAVMAALKKLDSIEITHQGALQAYLRTSVANRVTDLVRRRDRRPEQVELPEAIQDPGPSPLEMVIDVDNLDRYERALARLDAPDREAIICRVEMNYSYEELAVVLNKPTPAAARMAVTRAVKRLAKEMAKAARES